MKIRRQIIVFDVADLAAESSCWAGLLGGDVVADVCWLLWSSAFLWSDTRPVMQ